MFKINESMTDRVIRVIVGIVMIAIFFMFPGWLGAWNWLWWIGIIPLVTGAIGYCPIYQLLKMSTNKTE